MTKLQDLKYEAEKELGLSNKINLKGYANMTSRECGSIGGNMTRKVWEQYDTEEETDTEE